MSRATGCLLSPHRQIYYSWQPRQKEEKRNIHRETGRENRWWWGEPDSNVISGKMKGTLKHGYQKPEGLLGRHRDGVIEKEDELDIGKRHERPGQIYRETDEAVGQDGSREIQGPAYTLRRYRKTRGCDTAEHSDGEMQRNQESAATHSRRGSRWERCKWRSRVYLTTKRNQQGKSSETQEGCMEGGSVVGTRWHTSGLNAS